MRETPVNIMWFNFEDLGVPGWCPIERSETEMMLTTADCLVTEQKTEVLIDIIQRQRHELRKAAEAGEVNDQWISSALLNRAMFGLMGYKIPDVRYM